MIKFETKSWGKIMDMKFLAVSTALTAFFWAGAVSATTLTANFEGQVFGGHGAFEPVFEIDIEGEDATFSMTGSSGATGTTTTTLPFGSIGDSGAAASYVLSDISLSVLSVAFDTPTSDGTAWIVDGFTDGTFLFDAILAQNSNVGLGGFGLLYVALFASDTFSGTDLNQAIQLGLASAPTLLQQADYTLSDNGFSVNLSITELLTGEDPVVGNGDPVGSGDLSAVPLPASLPLMIAGLGAFAAVRRSRGTVLQTRITSRS